jgi:tripartite-type tricarboxylate transporter receptor subunit TctC
MVRRAAVALAVFGLCVFLVPAWAQPYPNHTVTIIVPYPAGGPTDQVARVLAQALSDKLKQNFIVEDISGGGTTIATARVAHAAPDGYMLLVHNLQISANVALYKNLTPGSAGIDEKADAEGGDAGRRRYRSSRHVAARARG